MKTEMRALIGMLQRTRLLDAAIVCVACAAMMLALAAPPEGKGGGNGGGGGGKEEPPPSPDIVYMNGEDVMLVNFDGSNVRRIYDGGFSDNRGPNPTISADGSMVVMMAQIAGINGVWTIRTDGTDLQLAAPVETEFPTFQRAMFSPVPAPDGEYKIAYSDESDLWLINLDGTEWQNLTETIVGAETDPAWSIDGTRIAVRRSGPDIIVYELGPTPGGLVEIVGETSVTAGGPLEDHSFANPAWANTQDLIVVNASLNANPNLWLIDPADPTSTVQLTFDTDSDVVPSFSPDDTLIYYFRKGNKTWGIWEMDAFGNKSRVLRGAWPNARRLDPAP